MYAVHTHTHTHCEHTHTHTLTSNLRITNLSASTLFTLSPLASGLWDQQKKSKILSIKFALYYTAYTVVVQYSTITEILLYHFHVAESTGKQ